MIFVKFFDPSAVFVFAAQEIYKAPKQPRRTGTAKVPLSVVCSIIPLGAPLLFLFLDMRHDWVFSLVTSLHQ